MRDALFAGGGALAVAIIALLIWLFSRNKKVVPATTTQPTQAEQKAIQESNLALADKALAQAKSDAEKEKIRAIMNLKDEQEKLRLLAEAMKNL